MTAGGLISGSGIKVTHDRTTAASRCSVNVCGSRYRIGHALQRASHGAQLRKTHRFILPRRFRLGRRDVGRSQRKIACGAQKCRVELSVIDGDDDVALADARARCRRIGIDVDDEQLIVYNRQCEPGCECGKAAVVRTFTRPSRPAYANP